MSGTTVSVRTIDPLALSDGDEPPDIDEQTGLPKQLKAYVVNDDPELLAVPHFLSDAEMTHLLAIAENLWKPSVVQMEGYNLPTRSMDRTSCSCLLRTANTETVENIEHRLSHLAGIDVDCLERLAMVRYEAGQHFGLHHDGGNRPKTIFIYLNDLPEDAGGETIFPELGLQVVPRRGCALMWANILENGEDDGRMVHAGLAPETGVKYGVNCFFHERPLKERGVVDGDTLDPEPALAKDDEEEDGRQWTTLDPTVLYKSEPQKFGELHMFTISESPRLAISPHSLTAEDAAFLIDFTERARDQFSSEERTLMGRLQARIAAIAGETLDRLYAFRTSKCVPGQLPDGFSLSGEVGYCSRFGQKTVLVFLNELPEDEGGELRFPRMRVQVRPRTGCAVVWSTLTKDGQRDFLTVHQGRSPISGELYMVVCAFGDGTEGC